MAALTLITRLTCAVCRRSTGALLIATSLLAGACNSSSSSSPTAPTAGTSGAATLQGVIMNGTQALKDAGTTTQYTATATYSDGSSKDVTRSATWRSSAEGIATVDSAGVVTARGSGQTIITATFEGKQGSRGLTVEVTNLNRTPDPAPGQRLPLPDVQGLVVSLNAARPGLIDQSCDRGIKYVVNPWLNYIVDELRKQDTRWGYNGKPTKTAADNNGVPVQAAGDEIAYHYGPGPDQGSTAVYLIDILESHCGTPRVTWRNFTGEEPGFWTGAGRF